VFHLVALTIVLSIVARSSTDILIARTFDPARTPVWYQRRRAGATSQNVAASTSE
jgi:hypothetical protein